MRDPFEEIMADYGEEDAQSADAVETEVFPEAETVSRSVATVARHGESNAKILIDQAYAVDKNSAYGAVLRLLYYFPVLFSKIDFRQPVDSMVLFYVLDLEKTASDLRRHLPYESQAPELEYFSETVCNMAIALKRKIAADATTPERIYDAEAMENAVVHIEAQKSALRIHTEVNKFAQPAILKSVMRFHIQQIVKTILENKPLFARHFGYDFLKECKAAMKLFVEAKDPAHLMRAVKAIEALPFALTLNLLHQNGYFIQAPRTANVIETGPDGWMRTVEAVRGVVTEIASYTVS